MGGMQYDDFKRMNLFRQDSETKIPEVVGLSCEGILGVGSNISSGLLLFYISILGVRYCFYIDEGVLFWEESFQSQEDDLSDDESYVDIISHFNIQPMSKLKQVEMSNNTLTISLVGCDLLFVNRDGLTFIEAM